MADSPPPPPTKEEITKGYEGSKQEFLQWRAEELAMVAQETAEVNAEVRAYEQSLLQRSNAPAPGSGPSSTTATSRAEQNNMAEHKESQSSVPKGDEKKTINSDHKGKPDGSSGNKVA